MYIKSEGCDDAHIIGCGLAVIKVNGKDYAKKVRGHSIVVVNAETGNLFSLSLTLLTINELNKLIKIFKIELNVI